MLGWNHMLISTQILKKAKNNFEKDSFKFINNAVIGETTEKVRKHRDIKLENETSRNYPELLILELIKTLLYQIWHGYVKAKYGEKAKSC